MKRARAAEPQIARPLVWRTVVAWRGPDAGSGGSAVCRHDELDAGGGGGSAVRWTLAVVGATGAGELLGAGVESGGTAGWGLGWESCVRERGRADAAG